MKVMDKKTVQQLLLILIQNIIYDKVNFLLTDKETVFQIKKFSLMCQWIHLRWTRKLHLGSNNYYPITKPTFQLNNEKYFQSHKLPFSKYFSNKINSETAQLHKFHTFANEDISAMEMEIVSKLIQIFLFHHQFVQVACTVMEMKTVYLFSTSFL